jgi:hypothetical protein
MIMHTGNARWHSSTAGMVTPVSTTFVVSLLLSAVAIQGATLNRDGMLYVDTARIFLAQGWQAAFENFSWPFLPLLMALISQPTGLDLEAAGHLLNSLFMAGTCALLVACGRRLFPEAAWQIALVVLAVPGINEYRAELLREYGGWFFCLLAFWLALRWSEAPRWSQALLIQAALLVAALFRPEALALLVALLLWQAGSAPRHSGRRLLMLGGLPLLGLMLLGTLYASGTLLPELPERLAFDLNRLQFAAFDARAAALATALFDYARDQAPTILFFGSLALVPLKFVTKMGIFLVPLLYAFAGQSIRTVLDRSALFAWAFLIQVLILCLFALDLQFLSGRYVAPLLLFAAPLTGFGLLHLMSRWRYATLPVILIAVTLMLANVITLSPDKQFHVAAGHWLAQQTLAPERVYVDDPRIAHYAGWGFAARRALRLERQALAEHLAAQRFDLVVLTTKSSDTELAPWLAANGLREIQRFSNRAGEAAIVASIAPSRRENTDSME